MRHLLPIILLAGTAVAADLRLQWDPSPSTNVVGYTLYAGTNRAADHGLTNALVRLDVGTNLAATVRDPVPGRWYFVATARSETAESLPSNEVIADVPAPPEQLRTVILQHAASLTNGWNDIGFFKVRIE